MPTTQRCHCCLLIEKERWQFNEKSESVWLMTPRILSVAPWELYHMVNLWQGLLLSPDHNHTPQTFNTAGLHSSIIFDFLPWIQIVCGCVCVCLLHVHPICVCCWAKMETAQSIKHLTIGRPPTLKDLRWLSSHPIPGSSGVGWGGAGDKGSSPGGVHFLSNGAVRHSACWQKAGVSLPPACTPEPTVWEPNELEVIKMLWLEHFVVFIELIGRMFWHSNTNYNHFHHQHSSHACNSALGVDLLVGWSNQQLLRWIAMKCFTSVQTGKNLGNYSISQHYCLKNYFSKHFLLT